MKLINAIAAFSWFFGSFFWLISGLIALGWMLPKWGDAAGLCRYFGL
jgi:hypothetical protein